MARNEYLNALFFQTEVFQDKPQVRNSANTQHHVYVCAEAWGGIWDLKLKFVAKPTKTEWIMRSAEGILLLKKRWTIQEQSIKNTLEENQVVI